MVGFCKACWDGVNKPLTGWITPKMPTAQPQAAAPQLEARLWHALPLWAHFMVGVCERVVAHVPFGGDGDATFEDKKTIFFIALKKLIGLLI